MLAREDNRTFGPKQLGILRSARPLVSRSVTPQGANAFGIGHLPPVHRDRIPEQRRFAGMERLDKLPADPDLVSDRQLDEGFRRILVSPARDIGTDQHAALRMVVIAGIDDVLVESIGPGETAVNPVRLPEARRLERNFCTSQNIDALQRRFLRRGEVVRNPFKQVRGQRDDGVIGFGRLPPVLDPHTVADAADGGDRSCSRTAGFTCS